MMDEHAKAKQLWDMMRAMVKDSVDPLAERLAKLEARVKALEEKADNFGEDALMPSGCAHVWHMTEPAGECPACGKGWKR